MKRAKEVRKKAAIKRIEDARNEAQAQLKTLEAYENGRAIKFLYRQLISFSEWRLRRLFK